MSAAGMKVLIAAYPRSGSTALAKCLASLAEAEPDTVLHEPFRQQAGPDTLPFNQLNQVVDQVTILKHHPGNLLSDRQNGLLYQSWIDAGGTIIHLYRDDMIAQARSLAIARSLNSYHRRHQVDQVDQSRVDVEHSALLTERSEQTKTLALFSHLEVSYEKLFTGDLNHRLANLDDLLRQIPGAKPIEHAKPETALRVRTVLDPAAKVGPPNQLPADQERPIKLIDQVPLIAGLAVFAGTENLSLQLRDAAAKADTSAGSCKGEIPISYGISGFKLADAVGDADAKATEDQIRQLLERAGGFQNLGAPLSPLTVMNYDGDRWPDHDVGVFAAPSSSSQPCVQFSLTLAGPSQDTPGPGAVSSDPSSVDPSSVAIRLGGHGQIATQVGELCFFTNTHSSRREPIRRGQASVVTGAFAMDTAQILVAGQLLGDSRMFVELDQAIEDVSGVNGR